MAQERDSSGRFKPKDSGGGEGRQTTLYQDKKKIPPPPLKVDSLEDLRPPKQGLTEEEGMTRLDETLPDGVESFEEEGVSPEGYPLDLEGYEGDPDKLREAMERLRAEGSTEAAVDALEEMDLDALEWGDTDSEDVGDAGEPIPFEALGVDADHIMVTATVQGEQQEVPLSEALAGYQRQETFTKKTQELAEKRKQLEGALEGSAARLQALDAIFGQAMTPEQRQQVGAAYQRVLAERAALHAQQIENEILPREHAKLADALGWEDESDVQEGKDRLKAGAVEYGFDGDDLENVTDSRLLILLNDAISYREMQDRAEDAKASARANRRQGRTLKPGTSGAQKPRKPSKLSEARRRLSRTGREEDAVAALDHILPDDII